jgi:alpha-1,2-mannosyltransferase
VRPMRRVSPSRVARVPGPWSCVALYGVSLGVLLASHLGHGWGFVDLHIYERGGAAVRAGAPLYALRFPGALAFTYPPFAALALAGVTLAPNGLLEPLFTAVSVALLPLLLYLTLRLDRRSASRPRAAASGGERLLALDTRGRLALALALSAAALWLEPVWTTLRYGQLDVLLATLVVWDVGREDGARTKGLGIGLAAAIKLTPAIFAVYLLASRRPRAALVAAGTFAATVALGYVTLPGDSREYWGGAFAEPGRVGRIENAANQSLRGALSRVLHTPSVGGVWLCVAALVALVGIALAVGAARRGDDARGFSVCALTALLISPVSWSHHWVLALPALVLFALDARRRGSSAVLGACGLAAVLAYAHVIWWVPINHPLHSELHLNALQLLFADAYVLVALTALVGMAVARISTRCILVSGHAPLTRARRFT